MGDLPKNKNLSREKTKKMQKLLSGNMADKIINKRVMCNCETMYSSNNGLREFGRMSISEQVKELRELEKQYQDSRFLITSRALRHAADTIESLSENLQSANMEQSAEDCGGWIPCKEKLPEDGVDVLVWFEYFRYGEYNRLFQTKGI